jgi:ribosome maturation factor RimP
MERLTALEARVEPTLEAMGFEVVRVALTGSEGRRTLQVMADRRDGSQISVDDCEEISTALSAIFDVEDPVSGTYDLEVSSAGIDRPLTRLKDFTTYATFLVKLETKAPVNGRKRFRGRLEGLNADGNVVMRIDDAEVVIAFENIGAAKLVLTDELIAATAAKQTNAAPANRAADNSNLEPNA